MQLATRSAIAIVAIVMRGIASFEALTKAVSGRLQARFLLGEGRGGDEGSIGEWVMILVMAVGIVLFIWSVAQPLLGSVLRSALSKLFR